MLPAAVLNVVAAAYNESIIVRSISGLSGGPYTYPSSASLMMWIAGAVSLLSQVTCLSAVMLAAKAVVTGQRQDPKAWLWVALRKLPVVIFACTLPFIPALGFMCLALVMLSGLYQTIGSVGDSFDPSAVMRSIQMARDLLAGATVLAGLGLPLAYFAMAGVTLGKLSAPRAIALIVDRDISRTRTMRFLALSGVMIGVLLVEWLLERASGLIEIGLSASILLAALNAFIGFVISAYLAVVVALAWTGGFIGPELQPQTSST
jgi:hypothetical protein